LSWDEVCNAFIFSLILLLQKTTALPILRQEASPPSAL
jgi:hypothetical protein